MSKQPAKAAEPKKLAVEHRAVAALTPYAMNSRTHSPEQIARIAKSIQAFGWTNPILVDSTSGIVAGHGRLAAAKFLGMETVPVIELAGLSDNQRRAYIIFDNQVALEAGWDDSLRASEIAELQAQDFDLSLIGNVDPEEVAKAAPRTGGVRKTKFGTASISYNLVFDDGEQQEVWFEFVKRLKVVYPDAETLAERLSAFLTEHGNV